MLIAIIGNSAQSLLSFRSSLIRKLVGRGHRIDAYAPDYVPDTAAAVEALGARAVRFHMQRSGTNPWQDARTTLEIAGLLRRSRPQAVLCYFMKPAIYGSIAAGIAGVRRRIVLLEGLGYGFAPSANERLRHRTIAAVMKALLQSSLTLANRVLVLNGEDRDILVERLHVPATRVENIGGIGVELDCYEPAPVNATARVFALAARMIVEKGVRDYVEAARRIKIRYPDTSFLLLGEVDDNPGSLQRSELSEWTEEGLVIWPGRVDDIQGWLKKCDVFVLPSFYREGVPRSIQEAMALGRAIITTDHVGCRDTVVAGENGYLVDIRNVDQLEAAMERLITQPGLARRMGQASRRLAEERFDARRVDGIITAHLEE